MHADFKIQGYETPDGSFAQFVRCQAPQLLAHSERLTLAEGSSYMLDLETVYKALYDVARVQPGERVFVEGAAGGTGLYAVACAALRGARVTGLVSTEDKGRLVLGARRRRPTSTARTPALAGVFTPVPRGAPGARRRGARAGRSFGGASVRERNDGALVDVVVSSVGRDLFARMIDLLGPGGRLVFYGATSGYTLTFLGKPGDAPARARCCARAGPPAPRRACSSTTAWARRARRRSGRRRRASRAALAAGARVVVAVRAPTRQAARVQAGAPRARRRQPGDAGARGAASAGRTRCPTTTRTPTAIARTRTRTLKPFGQAVGRLLATPDNPRGNPDLVVERAGQDTLGVSTFLARPFTGVVVYVEGTERPALVVLRAQRLDAPEARPVPGLLHPRQPPLQRAPGRGGRAAPRRGRARPCTRPPCTPWEELAEANQAIHENRHAGTLTVRVGATAALDGARTARAGVRGVGLALRRRPARCACASIRCAPGCAGARRARDDRLAARQRPRPGDPRRPRARARRAGGASPALRAAVLTGGGDDVRGRAPTSASCAPSRSAEEVEALAARAQRLFARIARLARADDRRRRRLRAGRRQRAADGVRLPGGLARAPSSASPRSTCT